MAIAAEAQRAADRAIKRTRVLALLDEAGADAVLLSSDAAVGWYLDGGRQHVSIAASPIVAVRVGRHRDEAFVTANERERLVAEELPEGMAVVQRPWWEPLDTGLHEDGTLPESALAEGLRAARAVLLPGEAARFRALGADAACALTDVLAVAEPGWSERRAAAAMAQRLVAVGADPLVLLVAGSSRAAYPHALPTEAPLGRRALMVVCARRDGLIANLSRFVSFGRPTPAERDAERRILEVEAAAFDATRPGARLSEVLAAIAAGYAAQGLGAEHWQRHHQGGAAGYAGRDPRATPTAHDLIRAGQAFTWNPWIPGAKVEDTVLLEETGITPLTVDPRWPTVLLAGRARPVALER